MSYNLLNRPLRIFRPLKLFFGLILNLRSKFHLASHSLTDRQCFTKSAPRNTSGPRNYLKWSTDPHTNQYFVLRWALKYFMWSAHRKSLGTTGLLWRRPSLNIFIFILIQQKYATDLQGYHKAFFKLFARNLMMWPFNHYLTLKKMVYFLDNLWQKLIKKIFYKILKLTWFIRSIFSWKFSLFCF